MFTTLNFIAPSKNISYTQNTSLTNYHLIKKISFKKNLEILNVGKKIIDTI